ncbi:RING finger protein [Caproicibacterium sp. XB2]|uniref:RING finger protein n=1 Tax=Caproicibacterium sp. XB2 TaxID=3388458 RepID=UPI00384AAB97
MTDLSGTKCPVCGKPFLPKDDIVVCPECGAPYHRACYQKVGHCLFEDKHGSDWSWEPPQDQQTDGEALRCPHCGHSNAAGALFCEHCGTPLPRAVENGGTDNSAVPPYGQGPTGQRPGQTPYGQTPPNGWPYGQMPFVFDPMAGVSPDESINGAKAGEVAKVVQSNTSYYLPVFVNAVKFHKRRFNFAAFLLGGAWMLYRKLYRLGAILTVIVLALEITGQFLTARFSNPLLLQIMNSLGFSSTTSLSMQQMYQVAGKVMQLPAGQQALFFLPEIMPIAVLVIHIIIGCTANKMYRKHCVGIVKEIDASATDENEAMIQYQEKGGVSIVWLTIALVCSLIASNSIYFLM